MTPEQQRAQFALTEIEALRQRPASEQATLKSHARALPAIIHNHGLGQAAAFYRCKGKEQGDLYEVLSRWLCGVHGPFKGKSNLLEGITSSGRATYLAAQVEALALLEWLVKFAGAFLADRPKEPVDPVAEGGGVGS